MFHNWIKRHLDAKRERGEYGLSMLPTIKGVEDIMELIEKHLDPNEKKAMVTCKGCNEDTLTAIKANTVLDWYHNTNFYAFLIDTKAFREKFEVFKVQQRAVERRLNNLTAQISKWV